MGDLKANCSVAFRPSLVKRLDRVAVVRGVSRSQLITDMIEAGLDDEELVAKAVSDPVVFPAMVQAFAQPGVMRALLDAIRAEVSEDQLKLFQQAVQATAPGAAARARKKETRRRRQLGKPP
jgi:hypothetical protein